MNQQAFYIFRHGETFATINNTGYGDKILTAGILEEGRGVIKKLAEYLKNIPTDLNVSSNILRCKQTSEIISQVTHKQFVFDKKLNEYFMESFESLEQRLRLFLKEIEEKGFKNIAICTHGAIIGTLLGYFMNQTFEEENIYNYPPPGILTIVRETRIQQISFNQIDNHQ